MNRAKTIASVGAGAIWGEVYQKTDSLNLSVVGGRGASIGVGGLLTGGTAPYERLISAGWRTDLQPRRHLVLLGS